MTDVIESSRPCARTITGAASFKTASPPRGKPPPGPCGRKGRRAKSAFVISPQAIFRPCRPCSRRFKGGARHVEAGVRTQYSNIVSCAPYEAATMKDKLKRIPIFGPLGAAIVRIVRPTSRKIRHARPAYSFRRIDPGASPDRAVWQILTFSNTQRRVPAAIAVRLSRRSAQPVGAA